MEEDNTSTRVPLFFPLNLTNDPREPPEPLLGELKHHLDRGIYTWKIDEFHIPFPNTLPRKGPAIRLHDLIQDPDYRTEMHQLAHDDHGKLRKLNFLQFQEIRQTGEFSVPSVKFPGQVHVWRLTLLLQKGWKNIQETARNQLAFALRNLIVWIPNRVYRSKFSIPKGVKDIIYGVFWDIPTLLWGWPEKVHEHSHSQVENIIKRKKIKYLLEDLKFDRAYDPTSNALAANQVTASDGTTFDFRLFNRRISNAVRTQLSAINADVEQKFKRLSLHLQKQFSNELREQRANEATFAQEIANKLAIEHQRILEERIRTDLSLERISPGIAQPIMEMLEADRILLIAEEEISQRRSALINRTTEELKREYPIRSRIYEWLASKINIVSEKFDEENKHTKLERAIILAQERNLPQASYFFRRMLYFEQEREDGMRKALTQRKVPARTYEFRRTIWNPKNWIIKKDTNNYDHPYYYAQTYTKSEVSSDIFFWRVVTLFFRTGTYWNNSLYALYRNIVQGPLGLRSLFSPSAFYPDTIVNHNTGMLETGPRKTQSFLSRLGNLWGSVFQSRREFEARPDVGFLGKSIARVFHLFWNYIIKGLMGTVFVVAFQPVLSVANIIFSTLLVTTSILWCPIAAVLAHLFAILIYDFESPIYDRALPRMFPLIVGVLIRRILYGGIKVIGSVAGILVNFLGFFLTIAGCGVHTGARSLYDFVMFYLVIKWRARLPATNSFAARRIQGPGLSRQAFFQIDPDLALVALQVKMESEELETYEEAATKRISQPQRESMAHIRRCLDPLRLTLPSDHPVTTQLQSTQSKLMDKFHKMRKQRNEEFPFLVESVPNSNRIVLERKDLELTLRRATAAVQHFYTSRVFPMKSKDQNEKYWDDKNLLEGDYAGLARALLANVFSLNFLSPLEEADKTLLLKIHHTGIHQYAEGLMDTGAIPDDLDISHIEYPNYYQQGVEATLLARGWDASRFDVSANSFTFNAESVSEKHKKMTKQ